VWKCVGTDDYELCLWLPDALLKDLAYKQHSAELSQAIANLDGLEKKVFNDKFLSTAKPRDWEIMGGKLLAAHDKVLEIMKSFEHV
jgi:hypothetical protein